MSTSWNQSTESLLAPKQQEQLIQGFINQLPEDQKKVVYFRYFEKMSFAEIAVLMNTSVNTSLDRMRYGLSRLRKEVCNHPSVLL